MYGFVVRMYARRSQSPRFGSRCFVVLRESIVTTPAVQGLMSQSPRFGSRCFVEPQTPGGVQTCRSSRVAIPSVRVSVFRLRQTQRGLHGNLEDSSVAIPSVRVSVFRPSNVRSGESSDASFTGRNPLGSGLGVSSKRTNRGTPLRTNHAVAIPSVRVSVFRRGGCLPLEPRGGRLPRSQSPRFGSRCFVFTVSRRNADSSVRVGRRNPLGSGLGVSS